MQRVNWRAEGMGVRWHVAVCKRLDRVRPLHIALSPLGETSGHCPTPSARRLDSVYPSVQGGEPKFPNYTMHHPAKESFDRVIQYLLTYLRTGATWNSRTLETE